MEIQGDDSVAAYIIKLILIMMDVAIVNVSFLLSLLLRFDGDIDPQYMVLYKQNYIELTLVSVVVFIGLRLYRSIWRYASIRELMQIVLACFIGSGAFLITGNLQDSLFPRSIYIIYILILTTFMLMSRFGYKIAYDIYKSQSRYSLASDKKTKPLDIKRIMLVGAGEAASILIKDFNRNKQDEEIVVVVDDDKKKLHANLHGIPVKGVTEDIPKVALYYDIDEIIIAMPSASKKRIAKLIEISKGTETEIKIFYGIEESINKKRTNKIRPVRIEDLLGREEVQLNNNKLDILVKNKVIMVTGGGGSIGSELCRQIVKFEPSKLIVFDIYENNAYDLQNELLRKGIASDLIDVIIGSVRDKRKLDQVFKKYKPNLVFHAAAHKHVPLMETSPEEAVKNNIFGTLNTAKVASKYRTDKFILISTDKAVNPTNVMGATKRMCEMIVQSMNHKTKTTDFVAVRFGNVLGSNGSVIPLFERQLEAGGPITVTHPDIIRYFMTIPEAVRLILEAMTFAQGGEIFVLDMGEPVKILDLAKDLIRLSGLKLEKDIEIKFTGLRPGEKLYEELLMEEEGLGETSSSKIFVAQPGQLNYKDVMKKIDMLEKCLDNEGEIRPILKKAVPTYKENDEMDMRVV